VVTDSGASGQWNQLTATLTPTGKPPYMVVELVSNNTATSGNFKVYFDDLCGPAQSMGSLDLWVTAERFPATLTGMAAAAPAGAGGISRARLIGGV
jgi:hypothetical protein